MTTADDLYAAAPASIERLSWSRAEIEAHQEAAMRDLLAHAVQHSPFHQERLAGVDPDAFRLGDLHELPTMTKDDLMGRFDDVVTDPAVTLARVEDHVARQGDEPTRLDDRYVVLASGGSSGRRGLFVWSPEAFTAYALTVVRRTIQRREALGITPDAPIPGAVVAAGSPLHATAIVSRIVGGPGASVAMTAVPATLPFDEIVARLEAVAPLVLVGYPSVLRRLAHARRAGRLDISPLAVGGTSEPLPTDVRVEIEAAFGVPMTNTFGSSEGLCGVSEPGEDAICFAEDTCIVELVDDDDRPVAAGETAAKALITNLVNQVQPLIRYELTDRFRPVDGPWPDGHLRATVEGRNDEPLRWGEVEVHPLVVRSALLHHPEVLEYQVHQTADGLTVDAVTTGELDAATASAEVADQLRQAGLAEPRVVIRAVDAIRRDPTTGKVRRFVPLSEPG